MLPNKDAKQPAKISLTSIKKYLKAKISQMTQAFGMLEEYKQEQIIWRTEKAKECTENKSCTFCGCDTPSKYYADEACEDPDKQCYPGMMDKMTWKKFKEDNGIHITLE